jgi:hypothetical protein
MSANPVITPGVTFINAAIDAALPVKAPNQPEYPPPVMINQWIDGGVGQPPSPAHDYHTISQTVVGFLLGMPKRLSDADGGNFNVRHSAFTQEYNLQTMLNAVYLHGKPMPSQKEVNDYIFSSGGNANTPTGPVVLPGTALNGQIVDQVNINTAAIFKLQTK